MPLRRHLSARCAARPSKPYCPSSRTRFAKTAHAKASRAARRAATWCGKRRRLLAHLKEGAAMAGVAEGDKEDRRADRNIDEVERDRLEEEVGAKIALEPTCTHPVE